MSRAALAALVLIAAAIPSRGHRLDEYLQSAILSGDRNRLEIQLTLTPGVAVLPMVLAYIDTDRDGAFSEIEKRTYAELVQRDLALSVDAHALSPRLSSLAFPSMQELREGRGEIRLEFVADLPRSGPNRTVTLDNRHQSSIAAYQVNCLIPRDPGIRITAQKRDFSQSVYRLEYTQAGMDSVGWWPEEAIWFSPVIVLACVRLVVRRRRTCTSPDSFLH